MYVEQGLSATKLAELCGCPFSTIKFYCKKFGITKEKQITLVCEDREWLFDQYITKRRPLQSIATELNTTVARLRTTLAYLDIKTSERPNKVQLVCPECGQHFERDRAHHMAVAKQIPSRVFYCSKKCSGRVTQRRRIESGQDYSFKKGWAKWIKTPEARTFLREIALKGYRSMSEGKETCIEQQVRLWLEEQGIVHEAQKQIGYYVVDFLLPDTKICLEVNGTYWHGHPDFFPVPNAAQRKNSRRDKSKKSFLENRGYIVVYVWEHDLKADPNAALSSLQDAIQRCQLAQVN